MLLTELHLCPLFVTCNAPPQSISLSKKLPDVFCGITTMFSTLMSW